MRKRWRGQFQESENVFQGLHYIPHGTVWEVKAYKAFKYNAWKKRLSRSMETVDKMLLPLPTKDTLLPGSWEEGCTATYIDSLYQTALFQLDIAVRMNVQNGKDAISLKKKQGIDEFLIERKNPLTVPPDFSSLPKPRNSMDENKVEDKDIDLKKVLTETPGDTSFSSSNNIEKSISDILNKK